MCEVKNKHTGFYILVAILMTLTLAKYAFLLNIHKLILTSIVILMALLGDKDEILATIMCCIPLHNSINFYVATSVCSVVFILKYLDEFRFKGHIILVLSMIIYELLHCLDGNLDIVSLLSSISPLVVLMIIISSDVKDVDYLFVVRSMAIVWIGLCFVQLANFAMLTGGDFVSAFANLQRLGVFVGDDAFKLIAINPNTLGIISILITTGLLQFVSIRKYEKMDLILIVFLLLFGMTASSKTFLVCFVTMVVLFVWGQYGSAFQKLRTFTSIIMVALFAVGIEALLFPETLEYLLNRFSDPDVTTGRDVLMRDYHNYIINNIKAMFFGIGLNDFMENVLNLYKISTHVPHNSVQELIVVWGLPGLIMFSLLVSCIVSESKKYGNVKTLLNYIPLFIILLKSMAGQLITSGYTMLALSFAYISLCQDFTIRK